MFLWGAAPSGHLCRSSVPAAPTPEVSLAKLAYRTLTVILAALAVLGQATYMDALYWNVLGLGRHLVMGSTQPALLSSVASGGIISLTAAVLAVVTTFRGSPRKGALPLGLALSVWAYILAYSGLVLLASPALTSPWHVLFQGHFLVVEGIGLAALVRFTAVFPETLLPDDLQDPGTLPPGFGLGQRLRRWLLRPEGPWLGAGAALATVFVVNAFLGRDAQDAALLTLTDLFRLAALTVVVLNLRLAFVVADPEGRESIHWVVAGFALLVAAVGLILGGNVLVTVTRWEVPNLNWRPIVLDLGVMGLLWGLGMGMFYHGRHDGGKLVRRIVILSFLVTMALLSAGGLEAFLSGPASARLSLPRGVGTLVALVVFTLVWIRTRGFLDRFLQDTWTDVALPEAEGNVESE